MVRLVVFFVLAAAGGAVVCRSRSVLLPSPGRWHEAVYDSNVRSNEEHDGPCPTAERDSESYRSPQTVSRGTKWAAV